MNGWKVKEARENKPNERRCADNGKVVYEKHHHVEWEDNKKKQEIH